METSSLLDRFEHVLLRCRILPLIALATLLAPGKGECQEIDFAHEIVPILKARCGNCHAGNQREGAFSINTRETLISGGESSQGAVPGDHRSSELFVRITTDDESMQMPPEGERLTEAEQRLLARWIDAGLPWESGFTFGENAYEPPLLPRKPTLPPPLNGRENPIDRILDQVVLERGNPLPPGIDDEVFLRRVYLDLIGLLPTPEERQLFLADRAPNKRETLVQKLLDRDLDYAEHWLTFWNDLLRNDYTGTGFITGGRKQITTWLYEALVSNKPYDQFARELIAPTSDRNSGFADGIRWRGEVSAGQTVEIQYAQSVGQSFLGINLKCASCHDSFIDRWKLEDAYGLAAIYANQTLQLHRCDKPIGKQAIPAWLFPELGQIDPQAPREERLQQLASLMTDRRNGRFTRTIVNRLWHRLMGRGIVHPTDAMQSPPWNEDLLDYLAEDLAEHDYDLKHTLALIATSAAYQSKVESVPAEDPSQPYQYAGPRAKRLTAEQFLDTVWQLTGAAPSTIDAPVQRSKPSPSTTSAANATTVAKWIWNQANSSGSPAGETVLFKRIFTLEDLPEKAYVVISCDNEYQLYVNGSLVGKGTNWEAPDLFVLRSLRRGSNELLVVAKNGGNSPNPAALFCEARFSRGQHSSPDQQQSSAPKPLSPDQQHRPLIVATDASWQCVNVNQVLLDSDTLDQLPWQSAAESEIASIWASRLAPRLQEMLLRGEQTSPMMARAALLKSDFLMRSLGRPNRDQIVSLRPVELTTLEAIDLSIGETLAGYLRTGAEQILMRPWESPESMIAWVYHFALSRHPTPEEIALLRQSIGDKPNVAAVEDLLWAIVMLPEFQIVR